MQACGPWEQTGDAHYYMIAVPAVVEMRDSDKPAMFAAGWTKRVKGTVTDANISYGKTHICACCASSSSAALTFIPWHRSNHGVKIMMKVPFTPSCLYYLIQKKTCGNAHIFSFRVV